MNFFNQLFSQRTVNVIGGTCGCIFLILGTIISIGDVLTNIEGRNYIVIAIHLFIVISSIYLVYHTGKNQLNRQDKYGVWSWSVFVLFVFLIIAYMSYHCFDVITYYNESVYCNS